MRQTTLETRLAGASPELREFFGATSDLLMALVNCRDLPAPVMEACDRLRRATVALGGKDIGPPPS